MPASDQAPSRPGQVKLHAPVTRGRRRPWPRCPPPGAGGSAGGRPRPTTIVRSAARPPRSRRHRAPRRPPPRARGPSAGRGTHAPSLITAHEHAKGTPESNRAARIGGGATEADRRLRRGGGRTDLRECTEDQQRRCDPQLVGQIGLGHHPSTQHGGGAGPGGGPPGCYRPAPADAALSGEQPVSLEHGAGGGQTGTDGQTTQHDVGSSWAAVAPSTSPAPSR